MMADTPFFKQLQVLRDTIARDVDRTQALLDLGVILQDSSVRREFFRALDTPSWIQPLRESGFFDNPPPSEPVEGGGTRHPPSPWPASEYLARMASKAPQEVTDILEQIKTDNWTVARDILKAAKAMPAVQAKRLVPLITDFVRRNLLPHDLKDVAELSAKLASEGELDSAMVLVRDALALPRTTEGRQHDEFWYIKGLTKDIIPALIPMRPRPLLEHLCEEVKRAIAATTYSRGAEDDGSCWWRPAIEEHEQNSDYQLATKVVSCLREACELAVTGGHLVLSEVLELLRSQEMLVFQRTHAIQSVGSSLRREDEESAEELPKEVQARFMELWDWYWGKTGKDDAEANPQSRLFGWWFVCGAFPVKWSLERLEAFVSVVPKPEPDSLIIEKLTKAAQSDPHAAVRILTHMVKGDDENWRVHSWYEEAKTVLEQAMRAGGETRKEAESLIDHLGRRGFVEFGKLLEG